ncbi:MULTISPECIES: VanZ family protein [unclassified Aureispira]|uniref:VanZ family protein n=1 Tax=unclassified Aureispira TaxID=2649989 RepID=UPI000698BA4C|nr:MULTISPECIES: VanZ family protein [unclassified Aureispira]WMX13951.1 VanZ family protein [Aureispira sp. CCB-E]
MPNWTNIKYFIPAIAWAVLIWSLSTTSNLPHIPWNFLSPDKVGHLIFYAILTLLLIFGVARSLSWKRKGAKSWIVFCMILAGTYGISLEFVQATIPGRSFDYADMLANFVGTLVGAFVYYKSAYNKYFKI